MQGLVKLGRIDSGIEAVAGAASERHDRAMGK